MIDLKGLTYANRAMCPAESVAPELWPDYAYAPVLGCSGWMLPELVHATTASMSTSNIYWDGDAIRAQAVSGSNGVMSPIPMGYQFERSIVSWCTVQYSANSQWLYAEQTSGTFRYTLMLLAGSYTFTMQSGPWKRTTLPGSNEYVIITTDDGLETDVQLGFNIYVNGTKPSSTTYAASRSTATGTSRNIMQTGWSSAPWLGKLYSFAIYPRVLDISEIQVLSADPLLPFRKKPYIKYFLPFQTSNTVYNLLLNPFKSTIIKGIN